MNSRFLYWGVSSRMFLASCLVLGVISNASYGDDVSSIISKSEASSLSRNAANEASELVTTLKSKAGQEVASAAKIAGSHLPPSVSDKNPPKKTVLNAIPLPHEGKKGCKGRVPRGSGKCASSLFEGLEQQQLANPSSDAQLLIFVSQSVPGNSIKELWNQAQKVGGKLVFRGLVGGSFKETQNHIQELEIVADIDPTKFEEFGVTQVPAFIISKEGKHDKMVGNVSLVGFLEQASISGDLKEEGAELYRKLQGEQP